MNKPNCFACLFALIFVTWPHPRVGAAPRCYPTERFKVLDAQLLQRRPPPPYGKGVILDRGFRCVPTPHRQEGISQHAGGVLLDVFPGRWVLRRRVGRPIRLRLVVKHPGECHLQGALRPLRTAAVVVLRELRPTACP